MKKPHILWSLLTLALIAAVCAVFLLWSQYVSVPTWASASAIEVRYSEETRWMRELASSYDDFSESGLLAEVQDEAGLRLKRPEIVEAHVWGTSGKAARKAWPIKEPQWTTLGSYTLLQRLPAVGHPVVTRWISKGKHYVKYEELVLDGNGAERGLVLVFDMALMAKED